jgi:RNA polymerase sigma-70 factor (ECF subfamily)
VPKTLTHNPPQEFERLLEPHLPAAVAYAFAIVRNRQDAEDAVQEAAIHALRAFSQFDPARRFKPWWLTILRNACRDQQRRSGRFLSALRKMVVPVAESQLEQALRADAVAVALSRLAAAHREILELKYFAECTYEEISDVLAIPEGTVMSRLHAARREFEKHYTRGAQ